MSISDDVDYAGKLLKEFAAAIGAVDRFGQTLIDRIDRERAGHPKAASWDNGPKSALVWCDLHERDVRACHADQWGCLGVPLGNRSDPTGDGACNPDPAYHDIQNLKRAVSRLKNDLELLTNIARDYAAPGPANAYQLAQTINWNDPHCENCRTSGEGHIKGQDRWVPSETTERTTQSGRLPKAMWLCSWCSDHVRRTGNDDRGFVPNEKELEQHYNSSSGRINCTHERRSKSEEAA